MSINPEDYPFNRSQLQDVQAANAAAQAAAMPLAPVPPQYDPRTPVTRTAPRGVGEGAGESVTYTPGFRPQTTVVDQYGNLVQIDAGGLDANGNLVIQDFAATDALRNKPQSVTGGQTTTPAVTPAATTTVTNVPDAAKTTAQIIAERDAAAAAATAQSNRQSAWDVLKTEFNRYGLGSLADAVKGIVTSAEVTPAQIGMALRNTPEYKDRFSANQARIDKGLSALSEADYIKLEDQYQNIMRKYGLPESWSSKGVNGKQANFEQFISNDLSPIELEDRVQLAVNRVKNAPASVMEAFQKFYPGLGVTDMVAYVLDPKQALPELQRKVQAAEIGGAFAENKLGIDEARARQLAGYGVTAEAARSGASTIAGVQPRATELANIYGQTPMTQQQLEQEVFNLAGGTETSMQRKKLAEREQASFSGQSGLSGKALQSNRAGVI